MRDCATALRQGNGMFHGLHLADWGMSRDDYYRERIRAITGRIAIAIEYALGKLHHADEMTGINHEFLLWQAEREQYAISKWANERRHLLSLLSGSKPERAVVSQADINHAKNYPVSRLIEFDRGKALCFSHADSNPSLSLDKKRNKAHCFVCGKGWDSIAILQERDGLSFCDAVISICGR